MLRKAFLALFALGILCVVILVIRAHYGDNRTISEDHPGQVQLEPGDKFDKISQVSYENINTILQDFNSLDADSLIQMYKTTDSKDIRKRAKLLEIMTAIGSTAFLPLVDSLVRESAALTFEEEQTHILPHILGIRLLHAIALKDKKELTRKTVNLMLERAISARRYPARLRYEALTTLRKIKPDYAEQVLQSLSDEDIFLLRGMDKLNTTLQN